MIAASLSATFVFSTLSVIFAGLSGADPLHCYFCSDSFQDVYDPYTDCQVNVTNTPLATCLDTDEYCTVQRTTVKGIIVSIQRMCTDTCYYGCRYYDFGVTQLICTSCCNYSLCNTDAGARGAHRVSGLQLSVFTPAVGLWTIGVVLSAQECV